MYMPVKTFNQKQLQTNGKWKKNEFCQICLLQVWQAKALPVKQQMSIAYWCTTALFYGFVWSLMAEWLRWRRLRGMKCIVHDLAVMGTEPLLVHTWGA